MEENATTTTSPPTMSNHGDTNAKFLTNSSKNREEGELSASENEEFAGSQFPNSTTLPGDPLNKDIDVEMGKSALTRNPTSSAVARASGHLNNRKGTEKYRVPFVISFSDDDSGSDSEEGRKGNTTESNDMTRGVMENRRLPTSLGNSRMMQQTAKTNTRISKKFSTSRTFVSSMNRVNGTTFKSGGGTFVGVKSQLKKPDPPSKNKVGQNVHINSSKLQDLRQLIAIRENELKSRAGKHDKEAASSSLKNSANMTLKSTAVRSRDSAERILVEPKEPEKKRLKVSELPTNTLISVDQHGRPPTGSTLAAGISVRESDGLKGRYDGSYCDKEILIGTGQSSAMQQINKVKNRIPSTNLPSGTSIVGNSRRHNSITNLADSSEPLTAKTSQHRQVCLNDSSFWNHFGATNMPETGDMDIKSLLEIEELQDKELDAAQEHRRKCEIEERNALKAYRKAQRALVEANARCSYLYHKRELFSANLRSHVMEDSNMFWSNMPHEHTGAHVNTITNMSENNVHLVPISHHQLQNEFHLRDQHQYDLNVRSTDDLREDGKTLVSESCGEPDTSASQPQEEEKTNDVCSSLHENTTLDEDEQTSAFELKAGDSSLDSQGEGVCSERTKEINDDTTTLDPTEDSLLLEATLRSQLFARLGIKTSKKSDLGQSMEAAVEREDGEIMEGAGNIPSSETEKDQLNDFEDFGRSEKSISEYPMNIKNECPAEKFSDYNGSLAEPILRSAFGYAKFTTEMNSMQSHTKNLQSNTKDIYDKKKVVDGVCVATPTDIVSNANKYSLLDMYVPEVGSYSNNLAINPFWPLCMFELRGKCNDDDCRWQHLRDHSSRSIHCNNNDSVLGSSLHIRNGATTISKCLGSLPLAPPTYLVCLDSLKADSHPYKYLLAQTVEQRWQKYFSASLVVSCSFLADLHSDESCLHGPEMRIEVHGGWHRQSTFSHGNNVNKGLPEQHMDDSNQPLEIALLTLSGEVNKEEGRRESLMVLARALEEHPTSALLWIVYLHIYYGNQKSIGNDDLFRHAVDHNKSSYELWLMFINSRDKLDDRLHGYNTALSALCRYASAADRDPELDSECILDLLLQMMNCLCSSGQVDHAIQKVYKLLPSNKRSSDLDASFLSDIDACLTISNKCILWICCLYLVMYKKLPDTIVQQLECQKELSAIEWDAVHLTADEKQQAATLMKLASESLASYIDVKSANQSKKTLKAAQLFALNHIRCSAVLQGFDSCYNLLKKYIQLYPSCLEYVLLSIRSKESESTDATYAAFEEALSNWVGKSGVQCIWNQYAAYVLENGRVEFAKELMERWFHSIWEVQCPKTETLNVSAWMSSSSQIDIIFGLLNLSLHKQLQNKHTEARNALEQVLEVASSEDYKHCVREHATCLLKNDPILGEEASLHSFLNLLNRYLMDSRALPPPEPLSRSFIKSIRNPKIKKLVNDLLTPISSDFSLLNLVLESCFGPSLLPSQTSERRTDVVDLAEALMEIRPANYRLALAICKMQSDVNASICFWASALLMDSLFQAVPVAPESVWVEAASVVKKGTNFTSMLESFHKRALSVYPYSMRLWKSYIGLCGNNTVNGAMEMAREKGMKV